MTNLPNNKQYKEALNTELNSELSELKKVLITKKGAAKSLQIIQKLNSLASSDIKLNMLLRYL